MKSKTKQFIQHLSHDIEDEDKAEEYLDDSLPLIGLVVMYFNSLEKSLDSFICETISDRSDEFHSCFDSSPADFNDFVRELTEVGKLRNLVVHADWSHTDEEGYTFVRLKTSSNGMLQEYVQFSVESLEKLFFF